MPNYNNFYNPNQGIVNQLLRQKDNIDNMISQYQTMPQQAPIQNIINQVGGFDFEAKILNEGEDVNNILINRKTMFLDRNNKKLFIKETDGKISEEYEIVVPMDEKDKKILELEKRISEMEEKENVKHSKFNESNDEKFQSITNDGGDVKSSAKTNVKPISK